MNKGVRSSFPLLVKFQKVWKADLLAILTLSVSSLLFFYDLFGERYLLTERDLAPYFIPPRFFWAESLKRFDFPLWNPYQFTGHPFLANPQHGLLYPLNTVFLFLPFDIAFNAVIIVHFFLAGLFTYFLLRDLKASPTGSLISGLIFMLGGYLLSVHSLLNILLSVTWTPLILLFFRRAMMNSGIRNEMITSILTTLSFLGGGIEVVYGNFWVMLMTLVLLPPPNPFPDGKKGKVFLSLYLHRLKPLLVVSFAFIFFSAVQLLPFLELWMHSIRGQGITYHEATIWSFAPKDLLLFFLPDAYGYFLDMKKYWATQCWLKTMYTGGLPFILSLIFFLSPHSDRLPEGEGRGRGMEGSRMFFLSLMFFSLFLSLGQHNPLYPLVYQYVPFFNGIRYPVKFLYIFILCLAITAGLGFEKLRQFSKKGDGKIFKHLLMALSIFSGLGLLLLVVGHGHIEHFLKLREIDFPQFNHLAVNLHHAKRYFFYLTLFFLLIRVGYEIGWKGWTKGLIVFFLVADLFGNMGFYGKERSEDYFKKTKVLEILTSDPDNFRSFSTAKTTLMETPVIFVSNTPFDVLKEKNLPSFNPLYRIRDIWGIDVVRLKKGDDLYRAFTGLPSFSSGRFPTLYGIKYVTSVTPIEDPGFELVYARLEGLDGKREDLLKQNTIKLYRSKNRAQRAWLLRDFKIMDPKEMISVMVQKDFDPKHEVLLEEEPLWGEKNGTPRGLPLKNARKAGPADPFSHGPPKDVEFLSETNNRLTLKAEAAERCLFVLSDTYYPGWKVFVNGKEEKILRANYNFRAVPLEKGTHRLEFVYDPVSFKLGAIVTLAGVAGIFCAGAMLRRKGSWKKKEK